MTLDELIAELERIKASGVSGSTKVSHEMDEERRDVESVHYDSWHSCIALE